jgi:hypothetical protein
VRSAKDGVNTAVDKVGGQGGILFLLGGRWLCALTGRLLALRVEAALLWCGFATTHH